jgi:diguanylate cyclase (GGDEF)-like protein
LLFAAATYIFFLRKAVNKRTLQLAIANDKLTLQANSDVLRGLYNRRFLMESLRKMKNQNKFDDFAILMIDIDFFKSINDNYGHTAGDIVLTILAKRMLSCMRENDILARIGGEAFCVILGKVSPKNMQAISNKVNQTISESPFKHREEQFYITVSIGELHIKSNQNWSSEQILQ